MLNSKERTIKKLLHEVLSIRVKQFLQFIIDVLDLIIERRIVLRHNLDVDTKFFNQQIDRRCGHAIIFIMGEVQ